MMFYLSKIAREMERKYHLNLPEYPGFAQIVELSAGNPQKDKL